MNTTNPVFDYFEADHDRLDTLLMNFQALKRTDYAKAKTYFREFKFGLQRHIIWEEEILFPIFERKTGLMSGPTEVMRLEHRKIGRFLEDLHAKVRVQDAESDEQERLLIEVLAMHNQKEELILYPAIDRSLSTEDQEAIFRKMKELPEERYRMGCHHHTGVEQE